MDWTQCLTIIGTTIGTAAGLFLITRKDMQLMDRNHREDVRLVDKNHKEDIQKIDEKMEHMDAKWDASLKFMDAKWERLFGLFVEQNKRNNK